MRRLAHWFALWIILTLIPPAAHAHHLWVIQADREFVVARGLTPDRMDSYDPQHVSAIEAFDAHGRQVSLRRIDDAQRARFTVDGAPVLATVTCEWGDRVNTPQGKNFLSRQQALDQGMTVLSAFRSTQFAKSFFGWGPVWQQPVGLKLEIVALERPDRVQAGESLPVQVLFDGLPLPDCQVGIGRDSRHVRTDSGGMAQIDLHGTGLQVVMAIHNVPAEGYADIDYWQYMTFLTFMTP